MLQMGMLFNFLSVLIMLIFSLVSVAFLTLLERKILGYLQIRKGPDSVGYKGLMQPFSDAIKLFSKEFFIPLKSNMYPYWISPLLVFMISVVCWITFPYYVLIMSWNFAILFVLTILSLSVYGIMICGWASNSTYSILGSLRVVAQSISYEVSFFLLVFCLIFFSNSMSMYEFYKNQNLCWFLIWMFPLFIMLLVSFLAELNRTPFDFSEGESELVSGFNVEYGGVGFAFIFLGEYLSIFFSSLVLCLLFLGADSESFFFYIKLVSVCFFIILIRGTLPRYRYDKLMNLCWKGYLGISLNLIIFYSSVSSAFF